MAPNQAPQSSALSGHVHEARCALPIGREPAELHRLWLAAKSHGSGHGAARRPVRHARTLALEGAREIDWPEAKIERPTDALVRITRTNISGSDLHMYEGRTEMKRRRILSREIVGEVIEVGSAVDRVKFGDMGPYPGGQADSTPCRRAADEIAIGCATSARATHLNGGHHDGRA